ncbi:hypothetical protein VTN00DRAFT_4200 [Thermoascus crustaceus]|uniref:uncharacterized protein n=1 Tax=Thermoascus crustaceus TaxID=5088 RepID=UPI0037424B59
MPGILSHIQHAALFALGDADIHWELLLARCINILSPWQRPMSLAPRYHSQRHFWIMILLGNAYAQNSYLLRSYSVVTAVHPT